MRTQRGWFEAVYEDNDPERVFVVGRHPNGRWIGVSDADDDYAYQFDDEGRCLSCDGFRLTGYLGDSGEPTYRELMPSEACEAMTHARYLRLEGHVGVTTINGVAADSVRMIGTDWMTYAELRRKGVWDDSGKPCGVSLVEQPSALSPVPRE